MKGGNLSQLNDYAMTHPACGECKHCEMQEKDQGKLCLSAIFSSGYKYADFSRWHDCSAEPGAGYDTTVTGLIDGCCWCQRASGIPGIWNLFPHTGTDDTEMRGKNWNRHKSRVVSALIEHLEGFWKLTETVILPSIISAQTEWHVNLKWVLKMV